MSDLLNKIAVDVTAELDNERSSVAFHTNNIVQLEGILAAIGEVGVTTASTPVQTSTPAKKISRGKKGKRGRPTDKARAAKLGITVEELKAQEGRV